MKDIENYKTVTISKFIQFMDLPYTTDYITYMEDFNDAADSPDGATDPTYPIEIIDLNFDGLLIALDVLTNRFSEVNIINVLNIFYGVTLDPIDVFELFDYEHSVVLAQLSDYNDQLDHFIRSTDNYFNRIFKSLSLNLPRYEFSFNYNDYHIDPLTATPESVTNTLLDICKAINLNLENYIKNNLKKNTNYGEFTETINLSFTPDEAILKYASCRLSDDTLLDKTIVPNTIKVKCDFLNDSDLFVLPGLGVIFHENYNIPFHINNFMNGEKRFILTDISNKSLIKSDNHFTSTCNIKFLEISFCLLFIKNKI